jgi:predicted Fe-S protein YdhL (DUF1289 family)
MKAPAGRIPAIATPCIDVCTLDAATQTCLGCGRTVAEIQQWIGYSDAERGAIMEALPQRRARFESERVAQAARIAGQWDPLHCSKCGAPFVCGASDCSTPCWCASYPPVDPVGDARCMCAACLAAVAAATRAP